MAWLLLTVRARPYGGADIGRGAELRGHVMAGLSRRRLLTSLGTAVGIGTVAGLAPAGPAAADVAALVLHGSLLRILGERGRRTAGSMHTVRGVLHAERGGPAIGAFFSSINVLAEQRMLDADLGSFDTQLFTMPDGTLTGAGTVRHDGTGTFTITGGSGRFAAARGTYTSRQSADHAGTGEALFTFRIG